MAGWYSGWCTCTILRKRGTTRRKMQRGLLLPVLFGIVPGGGVGILLLAFVARHELATGREVLGVAAGDAFPAPVRKGFEDFPLRTTCLDHLAHPFQFGFRPVEARAIAPAEDMGSRCAVAPVDDDFALHVIDLIAGGVGCQRLEQLALFVTWYIHPAGNNHVQHRTRFEQGMRLAPARFQFRQFGAQALDFAFFGRIAGFQVAHHVGMLKHFEVFQNGGLRTLSGTDVTPDALQVVMPGLLGRRQRLLPRLLVDGGRLQPFQQQVVDDLIHARGLDAEDHTLAVAAALATGIVIDVVVAVPVRVHPLIALTVVIVGEDQPGVDRRRFGAVFLVVACVCPVGLIVRVGIAVEIGGRYGIEGVHEVAFIDNRLVIVELSNRSLMYPVSDVDHVGEDVLQRALRRHQPAGVR